MKKEFVGEEEIVGLFRRLKERIIFDSKRAREEPHEHKKFFEDVVEGEYLIAMDICEYFKDIGKLDLSRKCKETLREIEFE